MSILDAKIASGFGYITATVNNMQCLILHQYKLTEKLPLILVTQERMFRITYASFGSTVTMITCVITVIVHTIAGWVSKTAFHKSVSLLACILTAATCANTVQPRASLPLCLPLT